MYTKYNNKQSVLKHVLISFTCVKLCARLFNQQSVFAFAYVGEVLGDGK